MRVGYFSPFVVLALVLVYSSIILFKPRPLEFSAFVLNKLDGEEGTCTSVMGMQLPRATGIDLFVFSYGIIVMIHAKVSFGTFGAFPISFTGWSWILLTSRAGLEFMAWALVTYSNHTQLAAKLATIGSSIRFAAIANAFVVCTVWNLILFPIVYFKSIPAGEKRRNFLKFNCSFFMTSIHVLNLPLAYVNVLNGSRVRLFTMSGELVASSLVHMNVSCVIRLQNSFSS